MTDLASIIIAITSLVIIWVIVSIPVWISAKIFLSRRASFGRAMLVTAGGRTNSLRLSSHYFNYHYIISYWKPVVINNVTWSSSGIFGLDLCIQKRFRNRLD
jgi:hypothetical protein